MTDPDTLTLDQYQRLIAVDLTEIADWCENLAATLERDGAEGGIGPTITKDFLDGALHAYRQCARHARRRAERLNAHQLSQEGA